MGTQRTKAMQENGDTSHKPTTASSRRAVPVGLAFISAVLFGASAPASKFLLAEANPFLLAGLLYLGAALFLSPFVLLGSARRRRSSLPRDAKNRLRLLGAVVFGGILGPVLLLFGLSIAPAVSVSLWLNFETVATAVLAVLFFGEHLGRSTWVANGGILLAGVLLSIGGGWAGITAGLLLVGACICWGLDNNLTALIDSISPTTSTFWKGLVAGTTNVLIGLGVGTAASALTIGGALILGGLAYGASISLYITSAQSLGATRSQMIFASAPFVGVLLAVVALGEDLTAWQVAAGLILIASLWLMFQEKHAHEHRHIALAHGHTHEHDDEHHAHAHEEPEAPRAHADWHLHDEVVHRHPHWPDLHHRHDHEAG